MVCGNTLSDDGHPGRKFDYMLSNPPFGVEWKKVEKAFARNTRARGMRAGSVPACHACPTARCSS